MARWIFTLGFLVPWGVIGSAAGGESPTPVAGAPIGFAVQAGLRTEVKPASKSAIPATAVPRAEGTPAPRAVEGSAVVDWTVGLTREQQRLVEAFSGALPRSVTEPWDDGLLSRTGRVLFPEPAGFRWGRAEVSGGLVTAWRRRNPFGLLNPMVLGVSW